MKSLSICREFYLVCLQTLTREEVWKRESRIFCVEKNEGYTYRMSHNIMEIPIEKWPKLRDLYADHREEACGYNTLQTFITWMKAEPNLPLKIYSPNNDWEIDGTYVSEVSTICSNLRSAGPDHAIRFLWLYFMGLF